jgi:hypothetical protein
MTVVDSVGCRQAAPPQQGRPQPYSLPQRNRVSTARSFWNSSIRVTPEGFDRLPHRRRLSSQTNVSNHANSIRPQQFSLRSACYFAAMREGITAGLESRRPWREFQFPRQSFVDSVQDRRTPFRNRGRGTGAGRSSMSSVGFLRSRPESLMGVSLLFLLLYCAGEAGRNA